MDLGLSDRVYIVTGASRGLGRACAELLAGEGARLILSARDGDLLNETASAIGGPERALAISGDLSEAGMETCLAAAAVARYGRLDGALISMGDPPDGHLMETTDAAWRMAFESSFLGPLRLARTVAKVATHEGISIVMALSTGAVEPRPGQVLSSGLHPGLAMAAKSLADDLGERNVRVNSVLPGRVDSSRTREADAAGGKGEDARRAHESLIPLQRYGESLELARPAVFLLSPAASYVTGTTLTVDGGRTRSP